MDDPTLTDEELAALGRRFPYLEVAQLIAALRASSAEVERLHERMTEWATAMRSHRETYGLVPSRVWVDAGDFLRLESATPYNEPEWMRHERLSMAAGEPLPAQEGGSTRPCELTHIVGTFTTAVSTPELVERERVALERLDNLAVIADMAQRIGDLIEHPVTDEKPPRRRQSPIR